MYTIEEIICEIRRELRMRRNFYPVVIAKGDLDQAEAARRIGIIQEILEHYLALEEDDRERRPELSSDALEPRGHGPWLRSAIELELILAGLRHTQFSRVLGSRESREIPQLLVRHGLHAVGQDEPSIGGALQP